MSTLNFIAKRYGLDLDQAVFPMKIPHTRWAEMPLLFKDLGFKAGVEVGVYKGKFSKALCAGNPELQLIGVDSWKVYEDYNEYEADDLEGRAYEEAVKNTSGCNVKFIKATSVDGAKQFENGSLDFVFIDANHDFEHVTEDLNAWAPKVRQGGLVCGHDYIKGNGEFKFGVIEAVNNWCKIKGIKYLFTWKDQCPSWMYVKEEIK